MHTYAKSKELLKNFTRVTTVIVTCENITPAIAIFNLYSTCKLSLKRSLFQLNMISFLATGDSVFDPFSSRSLRTYNASYEHKKKKFFLRFQNVNKAISPKLTSIL